MRALLASIAGLLLVLTFAGTATAATAMFYSEPNAIFGWATGYQLNKSETEARNSCSNAGGTDCRPVLECGAGYGAVAFAENGDNSVGMSCGMSNSYLSRMFAIVGCSVAANRLCWTASAFSQNGDIFDPGENTDFDRTYYVQQMLIAIHLLNGQADGDAGPQTGAAVRAFQEMVGLPATGVIDDGLLHSLLAAVGGEQPLIRALKVAILDPVNSDMLALMYAHSSQPQPDVPLSVEIGATSEVNQRLAIATLLTLNGTPCTLPARSVEALGDYTTEAWNVTCDQGDYTLIMMDGSTLISEGHSTFDDQRDGQQSPGAEAAPSETPPPPPSTERKKDKITSK